MNEKPSDQFKAIPKDTPKVATDTAPPKPARPPKPTQPPEFGGPTGPEPTRYGDWERNGRVSDF